MKQKMLFFCINSCLLYVIQVKCSVSTSTFKTCIWIHMPPFIWIHISPFIWIHISPFIWTYNLWLFLLGLLCYQMLPYFVYHLIVETHSQWMLLTLHPICKYACIILVILCFHVHILLFQAVRNHPMHANNPHLEEQVCCSILHFSVTWNSDIDFYFVQCFYVWLKTLNLIDWNNYQL